MSAPFRITVYDRDYVRQGWIGDPESLSVSVHHNAAGDAALTLAMGNPKTPALLERGARVVIEYLGEHLISGPVRARAGSGPKAQGSVTFTVVDDFRLFQRVLGIPDPWTALTATPGTRAEFHTISGPAETVLKTAVTANAVDRLGEPVTVAPDLGRGADITASFRFHPLHDLLFPAVDAAGIGVTVRQDGTGLLVDCYEPALYPRKLTEAGGSIAAWSWTQAEAEATDIITGGPGQGTARLFAKFTDTALAAELGERIEAFRDVTDTADPSVTSWRAAAALTETRAKSGLSVTFAESESFRYGGEFGVRVGDLVELEVGEGPVGEGRLVITDTLRSASFSWTRDNGLEIVPAVGDISDNTDREFAQALAAVAAGVRDLRRK